MTLVVDRVNPSQPQLHALIIGVGGYTRLVDRSDPLPADLRGLGHLSSPPLAASKLARWLEGSYSSAAVPLGSIELLISDAAGAAQYRHSAIVV